MATRLADAEMNELKGMVLIGRVDYLSAELGDPARYFPALRAKGVLFPEDCEKIKAKVTASEKVYEMIELIHTRHSEKDGHAMDVLMEDLRKQRVQAHIARELQRALARAKEQMRGDATPSPMTPHSEPTSIPPYRQNSLASVATPASSLTTPAASSGISLASPQFDMHPQFGALPPGQPGKSLPATVTQPSPNIDPAFGARPGTPPQRRGVFRPTQEGGSPAVGEVSTDSSFSPQYQNGDSQPGLDRRFSDLSYTTTSGTVYSSTSTEQSGLDFGRTHREFGGRVSSSEKLLQMEAKYDELQSVCRKKDLELSQLKRENACLASKYREAEDQYADLKKQHEQLREKMRNLTISEQQSLLESYRPGRVEESDEVAQLRRQLQEKTQQVALLERQVEQYLQENQRLQLSLSTSSSSARPHHLPIGSPVGRPPAIHRPPYTPARSFQGGAGDTPARSPYHGGMGNALALGGPPTTVGITPMRSMRVGDSLNQHNIHLQQSRSSGPRRDSPAYSPAKDSGSGKRLSSGSGDTPMGESYFQSSNSSLNSSGSKGSAGVMLQTTSNAEHSTMV